MTEIVGAVTAIALLLTALIVLLRMRTKQHLHKVPAGAEVVSTAQRRRAGSTASSPRPGPPGPDPARWWRPQAAPVRIPKQHVAEQARQLKLSDGGPPPAEPPLRDLVTLAGAQFNAVYHGTTENRLAVRIATLRGHSHNYEGSPGQDVAGAAWNARRGSLFAVVADGIGSKPDSGAVAHHLVELLLQWAEKLEPRSDPGRMIDEAADHMAHYVVRQGLDGASTMVLAEFTRARTGVRVTVWGIGDSEAWCLRDAQWQPVHQEHAGEAENATRNIPGHRGPIERTVDIAGRGVFVLATDGFAKALWGNPSRLAEALVREWREPPGPADFMAQVDFIHRHFHDDRAVVAVWTR